MDALAEVGDVIPRHDAVDGGERKLCRIGGGSLEDFQVVRAADPDFGSNLLKLAVEDTTGDTRDPDFGIEQANRIEALDVFDVDAKQAALGLQR
jgi:hypothetical protein